MRESTPRQVDKKSGGPQGGPKILKGSKILKEEERTNSFSLLYALVLYNNMGFPGGSDGKASVCNVGDIHWNIEKAREFQKNIYFCFIDYAKAFDSVDDTKLWKILQVMGIPDHLICLLRNLYAGQEAAVKTGHETTGWFQIGKGVHQSCILPSCLFKLYAEYIVRNAGLDDIYKNKYLYIGFLGTHAGMLLINVIRRKSVDRKSVV